MYTFTFNGTTYSGWPLVLTAVVGVYVVSFIVVWLFDKQLHSHVKEALRFLAPLWQPILFFFLFRWLYITDFEPLFQLHSILGIPIFIELIILVVGFPFLLLAAEYIAASFLSIFFGVKEILIVAVLPFLAIYASSYAAARATVRAVRGIFFFLAKPPSARKIQHTIKQQHAQPDTGARVQKVLETEARKMVARKVKLWRPAFIVNAESEQNN